MIYYTKKLLNLLNCEIFSSGKLTVFGQYEVGVDISLGRNESLKYQSLFGPIEFSFQRISFHVVGLFKGIGPITVYGFFFIF